MATTTATAAGPAPKKRNRRDRESKRPAWMEKPSPLMQALKAIAVGAITLIMLYPFVYVIAASFTSSASLRANGVQLFPTDFSLEAYQQIFATPTVTRALFVSVGITVVGTVASVIITAAMAYGLTRTRTMIGGRFILYLALLTMLFGAGLIPNFLLFKYLGLLDTYSSMILPGLLNVFNLVVIRNFFMNIPEELTQAARVDGANDLQILGRIVLPLSKAILAVIALFYAVGYWNDFFNALIYVNDTTKWPIQLVLNEYVLHGTTLFTQMDPNQPPPPAESLKMAVVVVATVPILILYPFMQKHFTKGVLTGAIKS